MLPLPNPCRTGQAVSVIVREWDPSNAGAEELEAFVRTLNEVLSVDVPGEPTWEPTMIREYLTVTLPGERRVCWMASSADGVHGYANLLLLGDLGVMEVMVHPTRRRRGTGRALVAAACQRAYQEGASSLGVEVIGDTPAVAFWESLGFQCAYIEQRSVLDLGRVDWQRLTEMAAAVPAGYRIEYHAGDLPAELLEPYAAAKASRREADGPDLELRPSSYDARRLAESLLTLNRRGMRPHLVLAVQEATDEVAALTEVVTPAQHPTRADQYDTIVVPAHRGLGLARAIKARMLFELRAAEPRLTEVQTWNALENDPIAEVNAELGFRSDRQWREYETDVLSLKSRLGAP